MLIRHGQSSNNLLYEQTGDSVGRHHDAPLTELGHLQAAKLGEAIANGVLPWRITHLHASLMTRAVQTAAPIAAALDLPLLGHAEAYEICGPFTEDEHGVRTPYRGATAAELRTLSPRLELPPGATEDGWFAGPYEGEDHLITQRASRVVASLRAQHEDEDVVALVTHGAFFQHLFRAFLGAEGMTGWVTKHNTAVSLFEDEPHADGAIVNARAIDWMPHLNADLISI